MTQGEAVGVMSKFTAEQWGMLTSGQARSAGVSRVTVGRLVAAGVLEVVTGAARVYRLVGAPADPDLEAVRAAWLQLGDAQPGSSRLRDPDAVVAGRSAALVLGLGDLLPFRQDFYVSRRRQLRRTDLRLRVQPELPARDWAVVDGLPVSSARCVVADLLADHEDGSAVGQICQDAVAASLMESSDLTNVVAPYADAYGAVTAESFADSLLGSVLALGRAEGGVP